MIVKKVGRQAGRQEGRKEEEGAVGKKNVQFLFKQ